MVKLANTLRCLKPAKVMVIGDLLLDTYTIGKVRRISPEAPVAVVHVHHEEHRPGGAGNVVLNLVSLGAQVVLVGRIGQDWAGEVLCENLRQEGVFVHSIFKQEGYKTPIKNRVIAENQQIVRIDFEQVIALNEQLEQQIIDSLPFLMQDIQIIAISDYGKGLLTPTLLQAIIHHANTYKIPIITDPKGSDFSKYAGTTLIKPNLSEAYSAAGLPTHTPLDAVAQKILQMTQAKMLMITRSEAGISLFEAAGARHDFPVHAKEVKDVTGAGDTVLAMLAYALANRLSYEEAAQLCNVAAGIAIEQVGCARVTLSDLAHRLFQRDMNHKVFDHEQVFVLQEILKKKPFHLLILPTIMELSQPLFQAIQHLTGQSHALLLYAMDPNPPQAMIEMLASLKEVSFILIQQDNLKFICRQVQPVNSYVFEDKKLKVVDAMTYLSDAWVSEEVPAKN